MAGGEVYVTTHDFAVKPSPESVKHLVQGTCSGAGTLFCYIISWTLVTIVAPNLVLTYGYLYLDASIIRYVST